MQTIDDFLGVEESENSSSDVNDISRPLDTGDAIRTTTHAVVTKSVEMAPIDRTKKRRQTIAVLNNFRQE